LGGSKKGAKYQNKCVSKIKKGVKIKMRGVKLKVRSTFKKMHTPFSRNSNTNKPCSSKISAGTDGIENIS